MVLVESESMPAVFFCELLQRRWLRGEVRDGK